MIVSLEAIFLSTFVLISQNRLSEESEHRADLAMHIGLLTEHELTESAANAGYYAGQNGDRKRY